MKSKSFRSLFRAVCAAALVLAALPAGAGAPPGQYTIPGDGTVHDTKTGLIWQQTLGDPSGGSSWSAAAGYCSSLTLAGLSWRVPSVKELMTLVDFTVVASGSAASIDAAAFPNTPATGFWSSSPLAGGPSYAWNVSFGSGFSSYYGVVSDAYRVRCVR